MTPALTASTFSDKSTSALRLSSQIKALVASIKISQTRSISRPAAEESQRLYGLAAQLTSYSYSLFEIILLQNVPHNAFLAFVGYLALIESHF